MRKFLHFGSWLGVGFLISCGLGQRSTEDAIRRFTEAAQTGAAVAGQHWAIPLIGGLGAAAGGLYHAFVGKGIPGVKAIPKTPVHRRRAVAKIQREAAKTTPHPTSGN